MIANAIAGVYLIISVAISIFNIVRPHVASWRLVLIILDAVNMKIIYTEMKIIYTEIDGRDEFIFDSFQDENL